jgi:hypothetical protein
MRKRWRERASSRRSLFGVAVAGVVHGDQIGAIALAMFLAASAMQIAYFGEVVVRIVVASLHAPERRSTMIEKLSLR